MTREELVAAGKRAYAAGAMDDVREIAAYIDKLDRQTDDDRRQSREGGIGEALEDAGVAFADSATLGAGRPVVAALNAAGNALTGGEFDYAAQRQAVEDDMATREGRSPFATGAGNVAGMFVPGVVFAKAGRAALNTMRRGGGALEDAANLAARAVTPTSGGGPATLVPNLVKMGTAGAVGAGAETLAQQGIRGGVNVVTGVEPDRGDLGSELATNAGMGFVGGAGVGGALRGAGRVAESLGWSKGWNEVARRLRVDPEALKTYRQKTFDETGIKIGPAEAMDAKSRGLLAGYAADESLIGDRAGAYAREVRATATPTMRSALDDMAAGRPMRTADEIETALTQRTTAEMAPVYDAGTQGTMAQPAAAALRNNAYLDSAIAKMDRPDRAALRAAIDNGDPLTVELADRARKAINAWGAEKSNPRAASQMASQLEDFASATEPRYRDTVLTDYARDMRRAEGARAGYAQAPSSGPAGAVRAQEAAEGFGEGAARRLRDDASTPGGALRAGERVAEDVDLQAALGETYGVAGAGKVARTGGALSEVQDRINAIVPKRIRDAAPNEFEAIGRVAGAAAAGSTFGQIYNLMRAMRLGISDRAQRVIAERLLTRDPALADQAVEALTRAVARNAMTDRASRAAAAAGGAGVSSYMRD